MPGLSPLGKGWCPVWWSGRHAVVTLPEHIELANADPIREQLLAILNRGPALLVADMTATMSCDYAGTDALARAYQRAVASGAELRMVITTQIVRRVFSISGLDRLVPIYPMLEAALAAQAPAGVLPLATGEARADAAVRPRASGPRAAGKHAAVARQPGVTGRLTLATFRGVGDAEPGKPSSLDLAGLADPGRAEARADLQRLQDLLGRVAGKIHGAGLGLGGAAEMPADALRAAVAEAVRLLEDAVNEIHAAAFAAHDSASGIRAGARTDDPPAPPGTQSGSRTLAAGGQTAARPAGRLAGDPEKVLSRGEHLLPQTLKIMENAAPGQGRLAGTFQAASRLRAPTQPGR